MPVMVWLTVIHTVFGAMVFAISILVVLMCYRLVPRRGTVAVRVPAAGCDRMSTLRSTDFTLADRAGAYVALTKPDVSFLVLMTTAAGFYMGARGPVDWLKLVHTVFGTMLIAAGTAALNHYIERESDRHMRRTASRPLPSGLLQPAEALWFGVALAIAGAADLWLVGGWLASLLGVVTCLSYLLAYTPLKKRTVWATFVGAFPGAVPPMIGWAGGERTLGQGRVAAVPDFVLLAVSALPCDLLDVPRRLRARGNSDAAGGGPRRDADVPANHYHRGNAGRRQRAAVGAGAGRRVVFLWRAGGEHCAGAGLLVGGGGEDAMCAPNG